MTAHSGSLEPSAAMQGKVVMLCRVRNAVLMRAGALEAVATTAVTGASHIAVGVSSIFSTNRAPYSSTAARTCVEEVEAFFIDVAPCQLSVADVKEGSAMRGETLTLLEGCDESIAGGECRTTAEGSGVTCDVDIAA